MSIRSHRRRASWSAAALLPLAAALALTSCAAAAPVSAVDYASGEQDAPVTVSVDGGRDGVQVDIREIRIAPGASTGEHCHYGQIVGVVKEGTLSVYSDSFSGGVRVFEAGDSVIEGAGYRHEGRNEGSTDVVLWATYITPEGEPLAETDLSNCEP